jgi:hypothetical protein
MNHHLRLKAGPVAVALCTALALGACTSSRFGSYGTAQARGPVSAPMPEPVEPIPSGPVISEPLPPLDGQSPYESQGPYGTGVTDPSMGSDIAALPPPAQPMTPPPTPRPSGRSALVGGWSAQVAGASCRVQLSSTPALDLYRASSSGCANQDLSRVSAWDYRDGEVYLYQSGGTVAARLRASGSAMSGVLAKSGAPLTLAR